MGDLATLKYDVSPLGIFATTLSAKVAAAPLPLDIFQAFGLRLTSDSTAGTAPIIRTVVLSFDPSVVATATASLSNTGRIDSVSVGLSGLDYILPPAVDVSDASHPVTQQKALLRALLNVQQTTVKAGGSGYLAPTVAFMGGLPPANRNIVKGCVRRIVVADPGRGYPSGTQISITRPNDPSGVQATASFVLSTVGGVKSVTLTDMGSLYNAVPDVILTAPLGTAPIQRAAKLFAVMAEGTPARGTVTIDVGHHVTVVAVTNFGEGYVKVPDVLILDSAGTGAVVVAQMGVGRIDVITPGRDYHPGTTVVLTPAFKKAFPDASNQAEPFFRLLQRRIQRFAVTPVISEAPVIS